VSGFPWQCALCTEVYFGSACYGGSFGAFALPSGSLAGRPDPGPEKLRANICTGCLARPVSDVFAWLLLPDGAGG
jgi:hypothetical protein